MTSPAQVQSWPQAWAPRCPATLALCAACALLTPLAGDDPAAMHPLVSWGVHADARHLIHDAGALLLVGSWAEARVGSRRMLLWCTSGVLAAFLFHAAFYPHQGPLMGISAGVWVLASASAVCIPETRAKRVAACVALAAVLAVECHVPWRSLLSAATLSGGAPPPVYAGVELQSVPLVHQGCAALGALMGWLARRNPRSRAAAPTPLPAV